MAAIREGAVQRVRPKAMTVAVVIAGLLPILLGERYRQRGDEPHCRPDDWRYGHSALAIAVCHSGGLSPHASSTLVR